MSGCYGRAAPIGGGYCPAGTCGCGQSLPRGPYNQNFVSDKDKIYECLCAVPYPCSVRAVTGCCCNTKPMPVTETTPKSIKITFKCPTYCTSTAVLLDPCCPPPVIPPTCPSPPAPATCCGPKKCGCR